MVVIAIAAAAPAGAQTEQQMIAQCTHNREGFQPDVRIGGCTAAIQSGRWSGKNLAWAFSNRGYAYKAKSDYDRAIEDFSQAIRLHPGDAFRYDDRASAYQARKDYDRAIADYDQAIRLDPSKANYFYGRAYSYQLKGDYNHAIADYDRVIRLDPKNVGAFVNRGAGFTEKGDYDRAVADYDQAIRLDPKNIRAVFNRASTYERKGDRAKAIADYNAALALIAATGVDPDNFAYDARQSIAALGAAPPNIAPPPTVASAPKAPAASPKATSVGRRVALVIGNASYSDVGLLANPKNDAKAVAAAFSSLGFAEVVEEYDLGLLGLLNTLKAFGDKAADADWAVVYFAGHGLEIGGVNYLIPVDAKLKRDTHVADESVTLDRVLDKVSAARHLRLVILDACRINPFVARMERTGGGARAVIGRGLGRTEPDGDVMVLYAAKHGTIAEDGAGATGPLAAALLEHLPTPALDVRLMFGRVRDGVKKATGGRQEPFLYGSLGGTEHYFLPPN